MDVDCYNPYADVKKRDLKEYKANFHTHSGESISIRSILSAYKTAGYDLVMISGQKELYNTEIVGKEIGIATVNGMEYIDYDGILLAGLYEKPEGTPQEVINECNRQEGFSVIAHPNWISAFDNIEALPVEIRKSLNGFTGIEIFTPCIFDRFLGSGYAVDVWDELLTEGAVIWGFGNDDFHEWHDLGRAWNMIYAESLKFNDIKNAVRSGRFYVSTGLYLSDFHIENNMLSIKADYRHFHSDWIEYTFIGETGNILHKEAGEKATYEMNQNDKYVRVEACGETGAKLWCQPVINKKYYLPGR